MRPDYRQIPGMRLMAFVERRWSDVQFSHRGIPDEQLLPAAMILWHAGHRVLRATNIAAQFGVVPRDALVSHPYPEQGRVL